MDKNNSKNKDREMGRNNVTLSNTGAAAVKGRKGCRWSQLVAGLLLWCFSVTALALATPTGVQIVGQSDSTDTSYGLRWNAVTGATSYLLVGSVNGACVTLYCILQTNQANDRTVSSSELPSQFRAPGAIQLQVLACNTSECSTQAIVNLEIVANTAPSVTLSSPADDAEYRTGDTVTLSATATDSQDNISSVKFYVGGRLVNTDTSSPYSYAWTATLGSHSIRARVTDSGGLSAYSSTHDITVTAPLAAPTGVRIVGKSDNTDSSYELRWNAVTGAGGYLVTGNVDGLCVTIYCLIQYNTVTDRIVSSSELPSQYREPGAIVLQVRACNSARSYCGPYTPVNLEIVANTAPTVTLTAPAVNSNLPVGTSVTLEASAADTDGSITKVDFLVDGVLAGTDTSSPYRYNWVSNTLAIHSLTAKATDNAGSVTTSEAVSVRRTPLAPAPTISNTVNNYDGDYTLRWNHTTGAQGYWIAALKDGAGHGGAYGLVTYVAAEAGASSDITSAELMAAYPSRDYSTPGVYEFLVTACTSQAGICSDLGRASITVQTLAAPSGLSISNTLNNYNGDYTLSWNNRTGAQGYVIAATKDGVGHGGIYGLVTYVATEAGARTDISSAELNVAYPARDYTEPGDYVYSVIPCTALGGNCGTAAVASITVRGLGAPAGLSISNTLNNYNGDYTLSWNHSAGAHGYRISASRDGTAYGDTDGFVTYREAVAGVSPEISSAELTAVYPDRDYTDPGVYVFSVAACTAQTGGACSTAATASITVREIAAPASLSISNISNNTDGVYTLSWDNVAAAHGYVVGALKNGVGHGGVYGYVTYVPKESGAQTDITSAELNAAQPSLSYTTDGAYEFLVVSCTAQTGGVCSVPSRASIRVYPEISNGFTAASATLPSAVANASAQESSDKVGASAGKFRVNESGAATYTMPLTLLAGTAGVEPPLSFHYNSQGGSGPMGRGWSIGGLSAIERCRQTLHQDRKAMPITWSDKDRFCLDGQRLVLDDPVNGTYGAVGTVYRTELDSFAKVTSVGGGPGPGNPDHFKVERKDGSVSYYGATPHTSDTDAKLLNSSTSPKTFRWALKKFSDSVGNPIWYIYTNDDNGQRIKEVRYAYGATETKPKAFRAAVTFAYAATARTDASKAHVAGYGFVNDKLLTKVTVKSGPELTATEIRHYKLSYQADNTVTEDNPSSSLSHRLPGL